MKIVTGYPPNIAELRHHFAVDAGADVAFCYGDTIFHPKGGYLREDLVHHEEVHSVQQFKIGVTEWWRQYIDDIEFRLDMEVEAYGAQTKWIRIHRSPAQAFKAARFFARALAGPVYAEAITETDALGRIVKESKK